MQSANRFVKTDRLNRTSKTLPRTAKTPTAAKTAKAAKVPKVAKVAKTAKVTKPAKAAKVVKTPVKTTARPAKAAKSTANNELVPLLVYLPRRARERLNKLVRDLQLANQAEAITKLVNDATKKG